jgi:hypothetical protein
MKKVCIIWSKIALLLFLSLNVVAQKQANHWYFGINAGLDFSNGNPVVAVNGVMNTTEGTSAISDANGNLLFYTDGVTVWNNTHSVMPNGTGLAGDVSTTQSALIVKKPSSSNLYYIFTLPAEGVGNFCYSEVDMTLDNGKGDVGTKNAILKGNVTEKLSGVYHCNGTDIWVMTHELGSNAFHAYLVTAAGVGTAVVSNSGPVHTRVHGQMKFNNKATMLACTRDTALQLNPPYQGKAFVDLHTFDNKTGMVTYSLSLSPGTWQKSYGLEFSPDNTKLYADFYDVSGNNAGNSELMQYNLTAANIAASGVTVGSSFDPMILRAMQAGPDDRIYISKSNSPFLCVINNPNASGISCNYADNAINVDSLAMGAGCMLGLPAFVQSYFHATFPELEKCPSTPTITNPAGITGSKGDLKAVLYYDHSSQELRFTEDHTRPEVFRLQVCDIVGKPVLEREVEWRAGDEPSRFDMSELPAGAYFARLHTSEGIWQARFLKP